MSVHGIVTELFWRRVDELGGRVALRHCVDGEWHAISWADYGTAVAEVAAGLVALGIDRGDRVGILASNDVRWHEADMAILSSGGTSVPAYPTAASRQVAYVLDHSGARVCFVGDRDQLEKILLRRHALAALEHVVTFDAVPEGLDDDDFVIGFEDLRALGRDRLAGDAGVVRDRCAQISPTDVATIVYTSGTTGTPKGAMLTFDNLRSTVQSITTVIPIGPTDRFLSFLPLSHIAERVVSHFGQIVAGGETWFARSLSTVAEDLRACRPTIFFAVPRVWEKFQVAVLEQIEASPAPARRLANRYLALGAVRTAAHREGRRMRYGDWATYRALDRLVGAKIRAGSGLDRARLLVSGAAPIDPELLWWFDAIGLPIAEVYGQTEDCGPTSLNPPGHIRFGTVGRPLPGVEVRIAGDGEILVRGGNVSIGYFEDPVNTAALLDADGWLHSGDLGRLDADGYLTVTGRKKDLIITSSGKNIAPQDLQVRLEAEPLISQAVVIGDGRPYLTALLALDSEVVARWANAHGKVAPYEALLADADLRAEVSEAVSRVNQGHAPIEQIKTWRVIPHELTVGAGELTPTLKVKRDVVADRWAALIAEMYAHATTAA
jgi:long-chain acyl-CoA synthetase